MKMTGPEASYLKGKKVLIFGLKRSGRAAALTLRGLGADVCVTDMKTAAGLAEEIKGLPEDIGLYLGGHPEEAIDGVDTIVVSPGVPMGIPLLRKAAGLGIEIIGELELGYRLFKYENPELEFYAVTGTNGKSTTSTLLHFMLREAGRQSVLAGNIGRALTGFNQKNQRQENARSIDSIVVEVSNFQLEAVSEFKPRIASILNLAPDHLDRYPDINAYYRAKMRIYERQDGGDYLVLNAGDPVCRRIAGNLKNADSAPKIIYFGKTSEAGVSERGVFERAGSVLINLPGMNDMELIKASDIKIKGAHNLENAMAAACMALLAGVPVGSVQKSLVKFSGLPHRMEFVRELDGVSYINDSKGTNPPAVLRSLESFGENPIILIAGGRDKNGDFGSLREAVKKHVKLVVLIGEASGKIEVALSGAAPMVRARDMGEAVRLSKGAARPADVVLLSPACASFDMFTDFEDRGRRFAGEVQRL